MKKVFFANLTTFAGVGGIERYNKCLIKALDESLGKCFTTYSLNDADKSDFYLSTGCFKGFRSNKIIFLIQAVVEALKSDKLIIGHINLGFILLVSKIFKPSLKTVILTHGIEVWKPLSVVQQFAIRKADKIFTVSNFTRLSLVERHKINPSKIEILSNTIDPFFRVPVEFTPDWEIAAKYNLKSTDKVIITVARIKFTEKDKGYDKVIMALKIMKNIHPDVKYLLVGKYDEEERIRLKNIAREEGVDKNVIFTGYVSDTELAELYLISSAFVMPSKKEGFGIVFIEAMLYGLPVIAGNKDGAVDALKNGELGFLVDPDNIAEIASALSTSIKRFQELSLAERKQMQQKVLNYFGYEVFKKNVQVKILDSYYSSAHYQCLN